MRTNDVHHFEQFIAVIKKLRGPNGCDWDKAQTPESMRSSLIEESYELLDAINNKDQHNIREEIGDILLIITMIAYMHEQKNTFSVSDAVSDITQKLIRRHPHVFAGDNSSSIDEIKKNWDKIKEGEKKQKDKPDSTSVLDAVPESYPSLLKAYKIQRKAAKAGFDWNTANDIIKKCHEEITELQQALSGNDEAGVEEELGDLLFSIVNVARFLDIEPSTALHKANCKFEKRFRFVESGMNDSGIALSKANMEHMEQFWKKAKAAEKIKP